MSTSGLTVLLEGLALKEVSMRISYTTLIYKKRFDVGNSGEEEIIEEKALCIEPLKRGDNKT